MASQIQGLEVLRGELAGCEPQRAAGSNTAEEVPTLSAIQVCTASLEKRLRVHKFCFSYLNVSPASHPHGKKFKASKKNQLIWIKDLNVRSETMKPLGKDTGEMFQVDGVGTDFLDKSPGNKSKNRHRITSNQKLLYCKTNNQQ